MSTRIRRSKLFLGGLALLVAVPLLLMGCAGTRALSSTDAKMLRGLASVQQGCAPGTTETSAPTPWQRDSRPFDADRMGLQAYHHQKRCARSDPAPTSPLPVPQRSSGAATPDSKAPRFCGLAPTFLEPGC